MKLSSKPVDIDRKLAALRVALDNANGRLDETHVATLGELSTRAGERMGLGAELTVVALAGATGSGKSSLFNALAGTDLAEVGVRRPTTSTARASVWGQSDAGPLLDWLDVPHRHQVSEQALDGLVLLDLPDHDSTEVTHRLEVDRLVGLVDLFVWVVDPQKYADAALHEGYLQPFAGHDHVTLVVLNQIDLLTDQELKTCVADLGRLLSADGLGKTPIVPTSTRTGEGVDTLRSVISERVEKRRAAIERLDADMRRVAGSLSGLCGEAAPKGVDNRERRALTNAFAEAAGAHDVAEAVAKSHRRDAALATGWPVTKWLRRLRPDALKRLHLDASSRGRTSLRVPGALERARVESAIRETVRNETKMLPEPWPSVAHERVGGETDELLEELDAAVSRTDLGDRSKPRWWSLARGLQTILFVAAIVGFLWLLVLFGLEWLQLPKLPTPEVGGRLPVPSALLIGGLLTGFVFAALFGLFARAGAERRRRRAMSALMTEVGEVAQDRVVGPLEQELAAYRDFCQALSVLG